MAHEAVPLFCTIARAAGVDPCSAASPAALCAHADALREQALCATSTCHARALTAQADALVALAAVGREVHRYGEA